MTDILGDLYDIAGGRGDGVAEITSTVLRPANSHPGTVVPIRRVFQVAAGQLSLTDIDPGPALLEISMEGWFFSEVVNVPESATPISFAAVLDNYVEYEPGVVSEVRANADRAEASAVRSEAAADRAEESEQYVQGVIADGVAAVRAEVQENADSAHDSAVAAAGSAAAAATDREYVEAAALATDGMRQAAQTAATSASQNEAAAEGAAVLAGQHRDAAAASATNADASADAAAADRLAAQQAAGTAATDAAAQTTAALEAAVATDRQAVETARTGAETAATAAGGHRDAAEGFAAAANASAQAADTARQLAEDAAANAQQGAPAGGWLKNQLELAVQESLNRADTALQDMPTATQAARGGIKLAGDLTGTAESPQIAAGAVGSPEIADAAVGGRHVAEGAIDLDHLSDVEPYPMNPSVRAAVGFAAEILTVFNVNGGWTRGNFAQDVQDDLDAGAAAYQKPAAGIPGTDIAPNAGIAFSKLSGIPFEMIIVHSSGTRKMGDGDLLVGEPLPRACTIDSVLYQFGTKDASGSTGVALLKNSILITGTNLTVTAANQVDGTATDGARTATATANNVFAQNDRLAVTITSLGSTPGKVLKAVIRGRYT